MIFGNTVHDNILLSVPAMQAEIFDTSYYGGSIEIHIDIVSVRKLLTLKAIQFIRQEKRSSVFCAG